MHSQKKQHSTPVHQVSISSLESLKTDSKLIDKQPRTANGLSEIRRIKIQPRYVSRVGKDIFVPALLLKGEWLRKLGFDCKQYVLIREEAGQLVISLENK